MYVASRPPFWKKERKKERKNERSFIFSTTYNIMRQRILWNRSPKYLIRGFYPHSESKICCRKVVTPEIQIIFLFRYVVTGL